MKKLQLLLTGMFLILIASSQPGQINQINIVNFTVKNTLPGTVDSWLSTPGALVLTAQKVPGSQVRGLMMVLQIRSGPAIICGNTITSPKRIDPFDVRVFNTSDLTSMLGNCRELKAGTYTICVQFFNIDKVAISREVCKDFKVEETNVDYAPPALITPENGKTFSLQELQRPFMFRWTPLVPKPKEPVTYRLKVWQLMQGQTGAQAMRTNQPIISKDVDNITQTTANGIITGPCKPPYLCDFIWNVQALNRDGKPVGENNGTSDNYVFRIWINNNGCPRQNVSWVNIAIELNRVSNCAVPVVSCASYDQIVTTDNHYLWNGSSSHVFSIAEQNSMMAAANQWALSNRPTGCNNALKSIISITYLTDVIVGSGSNDNVVGISVKYGCCTSVNNQQQAMAINLVSPANGSIIPAGKNPRFTWSTSVTPPTGTSYKIKIVEMIGDQSPIEALRSNKPHFEKDSLREQFFQYPSSAPDLAGKKYAWNVQVLNRDGKPIGGTNGMSGASVFSITNEEQVKNGPEKRIYLISPEDQTILKTSKPTFEWKMEPILEGVTYSITVRELEEGKDIESGKILFEQSDIRENVFRYPAGVPPLDTSKAYSWEISAYDKNKVLIGKANPAVFVLPPPSPLSFCFLFAWPSPDKVCLGSPMQIGFWLFDGGSGPLSWTLSNGQNGTTNPIIVNPLPTTPGVHSYILTVTRGSCSKPRNITFTVYPNLTATVLDYPSGTPITSLCWGEDAILKMNGIPPSCQVTWAYSTNNGVTWNLLPGGGVGNPYNTNPINWFTCSGASMNILFRGTVGSSCMNLPQYWPGGCSNVQIVPLTVWCPANAGTITPTSSTHTIQPGNKICSNNIYPVSISLSLSGNIGNIVSWTRNPPSIPASISTTISDQITAAGTYTYTVTVQNGSCPSKTAQVTIIVEDPIVATITSDKYEVCWGKDAKLTLTHNGPAGTQIQWQYSINCSGGPWTSTGVIGTVQNTNEMFGPSYPGVFPPTNSPCNPNKICWRAILTSPTGICGPVTVNLPLPINVIVPPTPPTISPSGPLVKCKGIPVLLTASTPTCGTQPITYQWYLNGLPVPGGQAIQAIEPGNYFVIATNKSDCASTQSSNTVTVRDCITKVVITGPCNCTGNSPITLTANPTSSVEPAGPPPSPNCGGPYTYLWKDGTGATIGTTSSVSFNCPPITTTFSVEVTNAMGCQTTVYHTIKKCN